MRTRVRAAMVVVAVLAATVAGCTEPTPGSQGAASPEGLAPCTPDRIPASLDGTGPGDLLDAVELVVDRNELTDARAWRILYVSTGVDETQKVAVCGLVVMPSNPADVVAPDGRGKLVSWAHGTDGVVASCQPSTDPASRLWGKTPGGIGAVAWGSLLDAYSGPSETGILQTLVRQGRVVAATDYQVGIADPKQLMPYVLGTSAGANVLDAARAATEVVRRSGADVPAYDLVTWGHSQGGHAALWAGQLARTYLATTSPARNQARPAIELAGVMGAAPASSFVAGPDDPPASWGTHLGDREMHQEIDVDAFGVTLDRLAIGPVLFSYVVASWAQVSGRPLAPGATLPAYPPGVAPLDPNALVTSPPPGFDPSATTTTAAGATPGPETYGTLTLAEVTPRCLGGSQAGEVAKAVEPYLDPARTAFFVQPIWGAPGADGSFQGRLDQTCRTTTDPAIGAWCRWLTWNQPGPAGENPFDKVPRRTDGTLVPVFLAQGAADTVVHCVSQAPGVPAPADCLSRQLFDDLSGVYCPTEGPQGHLELRVWRADGAGSPADHMAIPGQEANNGDLGFVGSPAERFLTQALAAPGGFSPGCEATVMNPAPDPATTTTSAPAGSPPSPSSTAPAAPTTAATPT